MATKQNDNKTIRKSTKPTVTRTTRSKVETVKSESKKDEEKPRRKVAKDDELAKRIKMATPRISTRRETEGSEKKSKASVDENRRLTKISQRTESTKKSTESRIVKTQFFPSKSMYSRALKTDQGSEKSSTSSKPEKIIKKENLSKKKPPIPIKNIKTKTREKSPPSLSISERSVSKKDNTLINRKIKKTVTKSIKSIPIEIFHKPKPGNVIPNSSPEVSSISERPRTATLRKGSIVNANIVGPEAPSKSEVTEPTQNVDNTDDDYEDDFDSYESDFEAYESESPELSKSTRSESSSVASSPIELQTSLKRISSGSTDDEKKLDSGNYDLSNPEFKHRQILDNIKESIEKENENLDGKLKESAQLQDEGFEEARSLQFINFRAAQEKCQKKRESEKRKKRGEELLSMITLNKVQYTLLDMPAVPYDEFIKKFGQIDGLQVSVQTSDDNVMEETQTEQIVCSDKWTQYPPVLEKIPENMENFWEIYKYNYQGVGSNDLKIEDVKPINENHLEKFVLNAGNLMLDVLAETNPMLKVTSNNFKNSDLPFSKSYVPFGIDGLDFLKSRPIIDVEFCVSNSKRILTIHGCTDDRPDSLICVWIVGIFERPQKILTTFGEVSCGAFASDSSNLILGGLNDGTIVVWDTKEKLKFHQNEIRSPTYITNMENEHSSKIIAIHPLLKPDESDDIFESQTANEICSVDEEGHVIVWSLLVKDRNLKHKSDDSGLAHWGSVLLVKNYKITPRIPTPHCDYICTDSFVNPLDTNHLYITTNLGLILHCHTSGGRINHSKYLPSEKRIGANYLEGCPFSPLHFMAAFTNGNISFYSRKSERPSMTIANYSESIKSMEIVRWSYNRPLIFYSIDSENTLHVWNLQTSDLIPTQSTPIKDRIIAMKLSPKFYHEEDRQEETFMVIATETDIHLHILNEEHGQQSFENYQKEKNKFLDYINRYV